MASLGQPPHCYPVSIKGVVLQGDGVVLLKNERNEWELPGGKLELGEEPQECLIREIGEEIGHIVKPGPLLDVWVYPIPDSATVLIVTFGCLPAPFSRLVQSAEHRDSGIFPVSELDGLSMPQGYRDSIRAWVAHPQRR